MNKADKAAIARVLRLTSYYIAAQPQDTLTASIDGSLMTWGEIKAHVDAAYALMKGHRE